ncbi:MAG: hypothetical protein NC921_01830 [Candidatus Omnitrophica bacterium]|nr:hypothetical protein [Candidatus Omnitrophota bacterium]MCM8809772.1 hypothetical protein [Candidatus Omnitrophota bacterium]
MKYFHTEIETISTREFKNLPFIKKNDLRDNYPFKMFSCDLKDFYEIYVPFRTINKIKVNGYTKNDVDMFSMLRNLFCGSLKKGDIIQNVYCYGFLQECWLNCLAKSIERNMEKVKRIIDLKNSKDK